MDQKVLLVEDNPADARLIQEILKDAGATDFTLVQAGRLSEALQQLEQERFEVMLLDLSLPDEQGLATLVRAHAQAPNLAIVVLTGHNDEQTAIQALRHGAQDYLVKGQVDANTLVRSMRYAIERSNADRALRESEERYRFLFENNPHPMLVHDIETLGIMAVNNSAIRHYGYSRDEFTSMTVKDIRPPEDVPQLMRDLAGEPVAIRKIGLRRHRKKDGTVINVEVTTHELTFMGRKARLVLAIDVTERIRLEEQLRHSQKMEAVGRLAGGVAHDFNNLLTVITGYGQMLLSRFPPDDPMHADMEEILNAANRAAILTGQLLAFSRRRVTEPRILDLNHVVENMDKMLRRLIGEDIRLESKLDPDLALVKVDPGQLEQVIMNLVVNARDAMPNGGSIFIETANVELDAEYARTHLGVHAGVYAMLAVTDTGRGMGPETMNHLFEPFFTTKAPGKGTGLGLSTVYGIVKQAGGDIWVYSEPGKGTTFKIYLPRVEEGAEAGRPKAPSVARARGTESVLVVEDDPEVRTMIGRILTQQGYRVLEAADGAAALNLAREQREPIHLLLTDVIMSDLSGRALAKLLAADRPDLKVLFMSGYTGSAAVQIGELDPGVQFIQKPFRPDALSRKIREVLDAPRQAGGC
ncbi:MAG: response regulator [Bryobacterales bacterium]|nr:response regulator [Bryobacterales bacterium]